MFDFLKKKKKEMAAEEPKVYTTEELRELCIANFPYDDKFINDKEKVINLIDESMSNKDFHKFYKNSKTHIWDIVYKMFPSPGFDKDNREPYDTWSDWMFEKFSRWLNGDFYNYWFSVFGYVRTVEEAANEAAAEWCRRIFNDIIQDNGAYDEPKGPSIMMLGSLLKMNAQKEISEEMISKVKEKITEFYLSDKGGWGLGVDYHPCAPLYDILKESGIPENRIDSICPWKTRINIDMSDNSVSIGTYQHIEYK